MKTKANEIDQLIREGKGGDAKVLLRSLSIPELALSEKIQVASFFRRLDQPFEALKILRPYAIGTGKKIPQSSPELRIEYADILLSLRLITETRKWLSAEDLIVHPHAKLKLAFSYFYDFQYGEVEKHLDELLKMPWRARFSDYEILTMRTNRLSAFIRNIESADRRRLFEEEYAEVVRELKAKNYLRLLNSVLVIGLQFEYFSHHYARVLEKADENESQIQFFKSVSKVFVFLARVQLHLISEQKQKKQFLELRMFLLQNREFEVLRELDIEFAKITQHLESKKQDAAQLIYSGTSAIGAKQSIIHRFNRHFDPNLAIIQPLPLSPGSSTQKKITLPAELWMETPLIKKVFLLLASERYLPISPYQLWDGVMKGAYYREPSSRNTIHQWIKRLKVELKTQKIPAQVIWDQVGYRLLPIESERRALVFDSSLWKEIPESAQERFEASLKMKSQDGMSFSIQDLMKWFPKVPRRTLQFYLKGAVENSVLVRTNARKRALYQRIGLLHENASGI